MTLGAGILALVGLVALVATDHGELRVLAQCIALGEGRRIVDADVKQFETEYFGYKYKGQTDNVVDWYVHAFGAWERPELQAMQEILAVANPEGDGVAVDVGANVGTHSLFLSRHAKTVHSVEPWPTVLVRLENVVRENAIENIVIHPVGVASEPGTMPFNVPPDFNLGMGSFSKSLAEDRDFDGKVLDLPLVVADDYFSEKGVEHIDLIKIDIEGFEKPALQGFRKMLDRDRPLVFMELNVKNEEGFHSEQELRETFPLNYSFFEIHHPPQFDFRLPGGTLLTCGNEDGEYSLEPFGMTFDRDSRNLVAVPDDLVPKLPRVQ